MIARLIQTRANFGSSYSVLIDNKERYRADIPMMRLPCQAEFLKNGEVLCHIRFDTKESVKNIARLPTNTKQQPFIIRSWSGETIGCIYHKITKYFFGYTYYEQQLNGRQFSAYEVGLGKDGVKIPIYEGDQQVALIEKGTVVYDNKDEYDLFALDLFYLEAAAIFNIYYDIIRFKDPGEIVHKSKKVNYIYTWREELKAKYDPAFRNRVEALARRQEPASQ